MVQSNVMFVIHLSVLSNLRPKRGSAYFLCCCKVEQAVCTCTQPEQNKFGAWRCHVAHQKSKLSVGSLKSTHRLKSHKDHRSWPRSLDAFSHLPGGLHTYVFRQFRPNLSPGWPRTSPGRDRPLAVIWLGRSCHFTNKALPLTKRIGNIVVFPALCKPRYAGISQNSSKFPLVVDISIYGYISI